MHLGGLSFGCAALSLAGPRPSLLSPSPPVASLLVARCSQRDAADVERRESNRHASSWSPTRGRGFQPAAREKTDAPAKKKPRRRPPPSTPTPKTAAATEAAPAAVDPIPAPQVPHEQPEAAFKEERAAKPTAGAAAVEGKPERRSERKPERKPVQMDGKEVKGDESNSAAAFQRNRRRTGSRGPLIPLGPDPSAVPSAPRWLQSLAREIGSVLEAAKLTDSAIADEVDPSLAAAVMKLMPPATLPYTRREPAEARGHAGKGGPPLVPSSPLAAAGAAAAATAECNVPPEARLLRCFDEESAAGGGGNGGGARFESVSGSGGAAEGGGQQQQRKGMGPSPYPAVEAFIESLLSSERGGPGGIRTWVMLDDNVILYNIKGNRYCYNVGREHRSNGVFFVVNLQQATWYQKCYDPECQGYQPTVMPLPPGLVPGSPKAVEEEEREEREGAPPPFDGGVESGGESDVEAAVMAVVSDAVGLLEVGDALESASETEEEDDSGGGGEAVGLGDDSLQLDSDFELEEEAAMVPDAAADVAAAEGSSSHHDLYSSELEAILHFHRAQAALDGPPPDSSDGGKGEERSISRPHAHAHALSFSSDAYASDDEGSQSDSERGGRRRGRDRGVPAIGDGEMKALLRLVSMAGGPLAAAVLHSILDAADVPPGGIPYPTRSPNIVRYVVNVLALREFAVPARDIVLRIVVPEEATPGTERGKWSTTWAVMAMASRPDLVKDLLRAVEAAGGVPSGDAYECLLVSHARAGQPEAAMTVFEEMRSRGLQASPAAYSGLVQAAVPGGDLEMGMKAVEWAEEEAARNPGFSPVPAWKSLLAWSCRPGAPRGLRGRLVSLLEQVGRKVSCESLERALPHHPPQEATINACMLFQALRSRGLVKDLPASSPAFPSPSTSDYSSIKARAWVSAPNTADNPSQSKKTLPPVLQKEAIESKPGRYGGGPPPSTMPFASSPSNLSPPEAALSLYDKLLKAAQKTQQQGWVQQLFEWLHEDGLTPNTRTLGSVCAATAYNRDPAEALRLYQYIRRLGVGMDPFMYTHLTLAVLQGSSRRQRWGTALLLVHRFHMEVPSCMDTSLHTSLVVMAGKEGWVPELLALYKLMLQDGVAPSSITWNAMIMAAARSGRPALGEAFASAMRDMGAQPDIATFTSLLSCAVAAKDPQKATMHWNAMIEAGCCPDSISCTHYMWAMLNSKASQAAVDFFEAWKRDRVPPGWAPPSEGEKKGGGGGAKTKEKAVAAAENKSGGKGEGGGSGGAAAAEREEGGRGGPNTAAAEKKDRSISFADACRPLVRGGRWNQSKNILQLQRWMRSQGVEPNTLSLKALRRKAETRGAHPRWVKALQAVADGTAKPGRSLPPTQPDAVAHSFAATAYANLGNMERARELANASVAFDLRPDVQLYSAVLDGCAAAGAKEAVMSLLTRSRAQGLKLDNAAYTSAIVVLAGSTDVAAAMSVVQGMVSDGITPNIITVNRVMSVCASAGDAETALQVFSRMGPEWGVNPDSICFATCWESLVEAGRWGDAVRFMLVAETRGLAPRQLQTLLLKTGSRVHPPYALDLHGWTTRGAAAFVRAWLLLLRRSGALAEGGPVMERQQLDIITGMGRNSPDGQSKLRPCIEEMLQKGLGRPVPCRLAPRNPGLLEVDVKGLVNVLPELDLGFGGKEEEDAVWRLLTGKDRATMKTLPGPKTTRPAPAGGGGSRAAALGENK